MADATTSAPAGNAAEAKAIITRFGRLKTDRDSGYMTRWVEAAEWMCPRKSSILGYAEKTPSEDNSVGNLFDITAMLAAERLAAWLMTSTSPANSRWFAFTTGPRTRRRLGRNTAAADRWWQHVTEVTLEALQAGPPGADFYTIKHEGVLDRNIFGTCNVGAFKGRTAAVSFKAVGVGTYVIAANEEGAVDTVIREFKLTARQAVQQFGLESLGPILRECLKDEAGQDKEFTFYHAVMPRTERDASRDDALNKPW